jgi:hypothetical protein
MPRVKPFIMDVAINYCLPMGTIGDVPTRNNWRHAAKTPAIVADQSFSRIPRHDTLDGMFTLEFSTAWRCAASSRLPGRPGDASYDRNRSLTDPPHDKPTDPRRSPNLAIGGPPEFGDVRATRLRSDLDSLGATLYVALTGGPPFECLGRRASPAVTQLKT